MTLAQLDSTTPFLCSLTHRPQYTSAAANHLSSSSTPAAKSGQQMDSPPVPDDLLLDIFLRIPDPADLVRVSAACVSFRGLVADRSFLRKYRKIHAPPLLGFLDRDQTFHPAVQPHPSAPAASAVALAVDFSFSFLPAPTARRWVIQDIRDGRVLLAGKDSFYQQLINSIASSIELVVCDPLHRRYLVLPPIADVEFRRPCRTFLLPSLDNEEETAFRVIWMARCGDNLAALVFSSSTGQWQDGPSHGWRDSFDGLLEPIGPAISSRPTSYAYGCFYWVVGTRTKVTDCREMLLVLDTRKMEFSIVDAPPEAKGSYVGNIAIVEAGEGRPGMFALAADRSYLNYIIMQNNSGCSSRWQFEKTISLDSKYFIMGSAGRYLLLYHSGSPSVDVCGFTLDVKTLKLERMFVSNSCIPYGRTYSNFPPSLLSTPTV
ncbi:unnamed protein product [Alopecurus aequalis]